MFEQLSDLFHLDHVDNSPKFFVATINIGIAINNIVKDSY